MNVFGEMFYVYIMFQDPLGLLITSNLLTSVYTLNFKLLNHIFYFFKFFIEIF